MISTYRICFFRRSDLNPDGINLNIYQQISIPHTQQRRYQKIDEICKQMCELGSGGNEHLYRLAMIKCSTALNDLKDAASSAALPPPAGQSSALQPPKRRSIKRGRPGYVGDNLSALTKIYKRCSSCKKHGHNITTCPSLAKATGRIVICSNHLPS